MKPTGLRSRPTGMKRLLLALGLAATFLVLSPSQALACSCVMSTLAQQAQRADVVVSGTVSRADESDTTSSYRVAVDASYKGPLAGDLTFQTKVQGAACGLGDLATDKRYLLMLDRSGARLSASSCGGTVPWTSSAARTVSEAIGPARVASGPSSSPSSPSLAHATGQHPAGESRGLRTDLLGGGVLITLIAAVALTMRRRAGLG